MANLNKKIELNSPFLQDLRARNAVALTENSRKIVFLSTARMGDPDSPATIRYVGLPWWDRGSPQVSKFCTGVKDMQPGTQGAPGSSEKTLSFSSLLEFVNLKGRKENP